ncbi:BapA/Bap/LapF family large adhesin [Pseudogemmobacter hezensis]|uniref:BapA/Bap/LapF family large adhesin n=1 Tax=Pseudogemmobacter hezensis TaxID=2737662 RepID=UPI001C12D68B|nr:BapA/Bap/LapF family large adhesin [Pseudogemmobacter hezensis]
MDAVDDYATVNLDILPADAGTLEESDFALVLVDALGLTQAIFNSYPRVTFEIEEGQTGDATFTVSTASLLGAFSGGNALIQMKDDNGNWVTATEIGDNGLIDLIWVSGNTASVVIEDLGPGEYRVFGSSTGISLITGITVEADVQLYDHTTIGGYDAETITGNVVDANDTVTDTTVVQSVNGVTVDGAGTTPIEGEYGTLIIDAEGNYSYTPNPDASGIGQVDQFTYTLVDSVTGATDTATLYVGIDSEGQGLIWTDPTQPAELEMAATDNGGTAVIDSANVIESGGPVASGTASIGGLFAGSQNVSVTRTFTIDPNDEASIRFVAGSPDVALQADTLTVTITGNNGYSHTFTGTAGFLSGLGVDQVLSGLPEGDYTVTATYVRPSGGLGGTLSLSFTGQTITHLDEFVVNDTDPATGNVLADDTLGSTYTKFLVDLDGTGNFVEVVNGTTVIGDHGTLTINADGSYSYVANSDLGEIGGVDDFTYRLEHPNGTTADATLSIEVDHGDGPYVPPVAFALLSDEFISDENAGEIPDHLFGDDASDDTDSAPVPQEAEQDLVLDFVANTHPDDLNEFNSH